MLDLREIDRRSRRHLKVFVLKTESRDKGSRVGLRVVGYPGGPTTIDRSVSHYPMNEGSVGGNERTPTSHYLFR